MKRSRLLSLIVIALFLPVRANARIVYEVIDLGTLGGDDSEAYSINNGGQIVGMAVHSSGWPRATLFDSTGSGNNINLDPFGVDESWATSINNSGQMVGYVINVTNGSLRAQATLFDPTGSGNNIDLACGQRSGAESINDSGQIVGWADGHATLFDPSGNCNNIDLGTIGGRPASATAINNAGLIAGRVFTSSGYMRATLFDPSGAGNNIDLGTLGGLQSEPKSINDNGHIVGQAEDSSRHFRATLFDPTGTHNNVDLGTLGGDNSGAMSINNFGQVVGYAEIVGHAEDIPTDYRATLFDPSGAGNNIDLNALIDPDSGWTLSYAWGINDSGWIVGYGINPDREWHAYLLIPEPATIALLGLGVLCLRRRRK